MENTINTTAKKIPNRCAPFASRHSSCNKALLFGSVHAPPAWRVAAALLAACAPGPVAAGPLVALSGLDSQGWVGRGVSLAGGLGHLQGFSCTAMPCAGTEEAVAAVAARAEALPFTEEAIALARGETGVADWSFHVLACGQGGGCQG